MCGRTCSAIATCGTSCTALLPGLCPNMEKELHLRVSTQVRLWRRTLAIPIRHANYISFHGAVPPHSTNVAERCVSVIRRYSAPTCFMNPLHFLMHPALLPVHHCWSQIWSRHTCRRPLHTNLPLSQLSNQAFSESLRR